MTYEKNHIHKAEESKTNDNKQIIEIKPWRQRKNGRKKKIIELIFLLITKYLLQGYVVVHLGQTVHKLTAIVLFLIQHSKSLNNL